MRIIGGKWRGRKLRVVDGVRPTPDRVRETLANWLAPQWPGARVLDLFAGSGALAFEALSRGAAQAALVDRDRVVARQLHAHCEQLGAQATVHQADALTWLAQRPAVEYWDVVFLDPPFSAELLSAALAAAAPRLVQGGAVYVETDAALDALAIAAGLAVARSARAGGVHYGLLRS